MTTIESLSRTVQEQATTIAMHSEMISRLGAVIESDGKVEIEQRGLIERQTCTIAEMQLRINTLMSEKAAAEARAWELSQAIAAPQWISVNECLPAVGEWCNVLVDRNEGDFYDRQNKPRYSVYGAQLREVDGEGYAYWQRWQMSDGGPMGSLNLVTHWQLLPPPPAQSAEKERSHD